jgi:hypothetical protein
MRITHILVRYAIKRAKQEEEFIMSERVANAVLNEGEHNFGAEVKRVRGRRTGMSNGAYAMTLFALKGCFHAKFSVM